MADPITENKLSFDEFPPVSKQEWESLIEKDLKGKDYHSELLWKSDEGFSVLPFYQKTDLQDLAHDPQPLVSKADWSILETIDQADPADANRQALTALESGASGLIFDLPADSIKQKQDVFTLMGHIHPEMISLHFGKQVSNINNMKWLTEWLQDRDQDLQSLDISFAFDPFSEALLSGKLSSKDAIIEKLKQADRFKSFAADSSSYANAGANIIQQLAFALSVANEYLNLQEDLEIELTDVASMIHFNFATAAGYFPEIAKYRAFRLLWAQILNAYDDDLANITKFHIRSESAAWNKSAMDAYNNMIRTTTETMSAALGGCNYIAVHRFDRNWASHSEFASRIARNTQHILKEEAYLNKVSDPGAGSYYIEKLTDDISLNSWNLFQEIEKIGGFHAAIKDGMIQEMIGHARHKKIQAYKSNREVMIGLNKYTPDEKAKDVQAVSNSYEGFFAGDEKVDRIETFNIQNELVDGGAE